MFSSGVDLNFYPRVLCVKTFEKTKQTSQTNQKKTTMADDLLNDDFFKDFKDKQPHFYNDSSSFDDAFERAIKGDVNKALTAIDKFFSIFSILTVILTVAGFVLSIIWIFIRKYKGESCGSYYGRNRRGHTMIPPPPHYPCKHTYTISFHKEKQWQYTCQSCMVLLLQCYHEINRNDQHAYIQWAARFMRTKRHFSAIEIFTKSPHTRIRIGD